MRLALLLAGTRIVVEGRENARRRANTVFISNHVSHLDAPVLFEALAPDLKVVVKKEIFAWPFLGPVLRRAGFVEVDRRDRMQSGQALSRVGRVAAGGRLLPRVPGRHALAHG